MEFVAESLRCLGTLGTWISPLLSVVLCVYKKFIKKEGNLSISQSEKANFKLLSIQVIVCVLSIWIDSIELPLWLETFNLKVYGPSTETCSSNLISLQAISLLVDLHRTVHIAQCESLMKIPGLDL